MAYNENFKNESQDARRKDEHNLIHPNDKARKFDEKLNKDRLKTSDSKNTLKK